MRIADVRRKPVLGKRRLDSRDKVAAIRLVVGMLQLAPATFRKVAARGLLVVRSERERPVVQHGIAGDCKGDVTAAFGHAVATRRNPDDELVHNWSNARGMAATRSSAIICGPASFAARP